MLQFDADNRAGKYITLPRDGANVPLVNNDELDYTGSVGLGTPEQVFTIDFDTGSSNLWVPSSSCSKCGFTGQPFNPSASTTYVANGEPLQITYGSGSVSGILAEDVLTVGGLEVKGQTFGLINHAQGFSGSGISGLFGLAFQTISEDDVVTPLENMVSQGLISDNLFSIFISSNVAVPGQLTFGGMDSSLFVGEPAYVPISQDEWYVVQFGKMMIGDHVASLSGGPGIVDSGTSLFIVPVAVGKVLAQYIKVDAKCGSSNYANPNVTISLGGDTFTLTPQQYIVQLSATQCISGFQGASIAPQVQFIAGDVFMRSVYNIFDVANNRLGFAKLAPGVNGN